MLIYKRGSAARNAFHMCAGCESETAGSKRDWNV